MNKYDMLKEIQALLTLITQKTIQIDQSNLPMAIKRKAVQIFRDTINMVLEESSPQKINHLVNEEIRKKHNAKLLQK